MVRLVPLLLAAILCGCSTLQPASGYRDSAVSDGNRAPHGLAPEKADDIAQSINPTSVQTQADYHYARGEAFSMEGQHQKAIEAFRMVQVYDANSAQVPLRLAAEYVKTGNLTQALEFAEEAVKKNPSYVDARLVLGGLYSSLKSYPKALEQFQKAIQLDPKNEEGHLYLGAVYSETKQYDLAVSTFEKLTKLEAFQNTHLAHYYVARVRMEQNTKESLVQAEKSLQKALSLKPDHFESVVALGSLFRSQKKEAQTLKIYEKYQKEYGPNVRMAEILSQMYLEAEKFDLALDQLEILEKNSDEALNVKLRIAMIYIQKKNYAQAISRLQDIVQQVPESDKIRFYLAAVYEETGDFAKALEHFRMIAPESQFYGESVVHAAHLLKKSKRYDEAIQVVEPATKHRPDLPQLVAVYASLLDDRNELDRSLEVLTEGLRKFPDNTQLLFFLGSVQDRLGKKEECIGSMQKLVSLDPNHVQGLNYLAYTYAETGGDLKEAEKLVQRALAIEPKDGFILDTYGWIQYKLGRYAEAVKTLEKAHGLQPKEAIIAEHLGDAYQKIRVYQRAQAMYQKAIEAEPDQKRRKLIEAKAVALEQQITIRAAASNGE